MVVMVTESPGDDNSKKREKCRKRRERKRRAKNKARVGLEMHDNLEASDKMRDCKVANDRSEMIILEADLTVQPHVGNPKTDAGSTETLSEGKTKKKKKERKKKATVEDETQSVGQTNVDAEVGSTENTMNGNVTEEKTKKAAVKDDDQSMSQTNIDVGSKENPMEGNVTVKRKRKKPKKAKVEDEVQALCQTNADTGAKNKARIGLEMHDNMEASDKTRDCKVADGNSEKIILEMDLTVRSLGENPKTYAVSTETLSEGKAKKKKKKKKRKKKVAVEDETQSMGQTNADAEVGSTEKPLEGKMTEEKTNNAAVEDEDQSMGQTNFSVGSAENHTEGNVTVKRKRKKSKMATVEDEVQAVGQTDADGGCTENLTEGNVTGKRKKNKKAVAEDEVQSTGQINTDAGPTENPVEGNATRKRKKKKKKKIKKEIEDVSLSDVKDVGCLCLVNGPVISTRRKLLVLDLNGLLADIVMPPPKHCRGDTRISGREIFKRPFYDDFLQFCFENFDVGIWSSRSKRIICRVVDYLLGDLKSKLLFCWDLSHTTQTGVKTLENRHKPLVCKELRKIWESEYPNCSWKKGDYNESNTLLLDDSPYKALLNPMHTAIFPHSYSFMDKNEDNSLSPGGDLRVYLEGLLASENVQKYVEQHPFGQEAITKKNSSWGFYSKVLNQVSNDRENKTPVKPC
ncbi:hypothetical protein CASFOL_018845 [Castilleja foliolosa]|uniref:FCP1 homology domain-containing protein n=1 Tax=Castilleja foliolosa TaxID=1961234 RepID=A0ABD3D2P7_9LAMI